MRSFKKKISRKLTFLRDNPLMPDFLVHLIDFIRYEVVYDWDDHDIPVPDYIEDDFI